MIRTITWIIVVIAVVINFGLALAQPRIHIQPTNEIPYPIRLQLGDNIKIVCPICREDGHRSIVYPGKCIYVAAYEPRYIDEEGVIHVEKTGDIVCSYQCDRGHEFKYSFLEHDSFITVRKRDLNQMSNGTLSKSGVIEELSGRIKK